ncbi:ZP domain-containing protein-like [Alosa sapidissima]|uniref:ZP domain-containing protein-like n=1 Tax=Alosa sapidissima TaxID=34773 RepID=UPI001C088759|nr:ZP domain-containing protein-like [Alosa sapidissima]
MLATKLSLVALLMAACSVYTDAKSSIACEHTPVNLTCETGQIVVYAANYGRTDATTCPGGPIQTTNCAASNSLSIVANRCDGKTSCSVQASNSIFTDPCIGTFKYLNISYSCINTKSSIACEHTPVSLTCETGKIMVHTANYGRTDATTCPGGPIQTTNCAASNSLSIMENRCDGKTSCSVQASNSIFTDPCIGTFKYLNISYSCINTIESRVICTENTMSIVIERSSAIGLHEDHLRLNDPLCTLYSNGTHVLANTSLSTCGTQMEDDGESLIFSNEVVSFDDLTDVITRRHDVEIQFSCKYPKRTNVTVQFDAHRPPLTFMQRGFGTFTYRFEFFSSNGFSQMRDPNSYPLEFDLGDMMFMQIESISSIPNTELFAESCTAAPSDDPQEALSYPIIQNGCEVDDTVEFYSGHQSKVQFGMKAFKFIGLHDHVFITCSVILCEAGVPGSRCSQGCTNGSVSGHQIHKRDVPVQTASHFISQGPLRLRRALVNANNGANTGVANKGLSLNLVFVIGGLLAAVAMVCGVLIHRNRSPDIRYDKLPSTDI